MQGELDFNNPLARDVDAIDLWRKQREEQQLELARKLGLPIGQEVEVWLRGAIRLRGKLQLHEETLFHPEGEKKFAVDGTPFSADEIESCIRI
jgi:hypothetical protein